MVTTHTLEPKAGRCLACRRELTHRTQRERDGELVGRALFVCLGHSPSVFDRVAAQVEALEAEGYVILEPFGTVRCPGCYTSSILDTVHPIGSDECKVAGHERRLSIAESSR